MNIRYQVFVSSTYADLKDERSKVIQTIMELDCIPAGMEIFPAIDEEQFNFIKRIIDDCDYYLLIIGGRYGTVSEDGLSYTEKEYDYAIQKNIKVLAFIHSNPDDIPLGKSEKDGILREKLIMFKQKVSENRLVRFWNKTDDLPGLVALSLSKTIKTYPALGWIRSNTITNPELLEQINNLQGENSELLKKINSQTPSSSSIEDLATLDDTIEIVGEHIYSSSHEWTTTVTWRTIFSVLSPHLLEHPNDQLVKQKLSRDIYDLTENIGSRPVLKDSIYQTIKIHLITLELIKVEYLGTTKGGMALFWALTDKGKQLLKDLRSVKKSQS
jgi:hypothetical protein